MQVEQIAILAPLQQRTQLGRKDFFGLEREDVRCCAVPITLDREWER